MRNLFPLLLLLTACGKTEELCGDGIDDDGDGLVDCFDIDCATADVCQVEVCDNGVDDDADGTADCEDSDCAGDAACDEICDNGTDDDLDGDTDCDDADCLGDSACDEICDNGTDDDGDGDTDCADADCAGDPACDEICDNGADDDFDGDTDCADSDCVGDPACDEICDNGVDDDFDGDTDCADSDCVGDPACDEICDNDVDDDFDGDTDCDDSDCADEPICQPELDCTDGIDNEGDGDADCDDSDCAWDVTCLTPGLATCSTTGTTSLPFTGELTCGDETGTIDWDTFELSVASGDCVDVQIDNGVGGADLFAFVTDASGTYYGLASDYSQLDDEVACSTTVWDGFACPSAAVSTSAGGRFRIAVAQWAGGCASGLSEYTLHVAVNGTDVDLSSAQTADDVELL